MSPDNKIDILSDHYNETNSLRLQAQTKRDRYFVVLCVLEAISFLFLVTPEKCLSLVQELLHGKLEASLSLGNTIFQTLMWILIAYTTIQYISKTLYIERQYTYQEKIEKKISTLLEEDSLFNREGKHYSSDHFPIVLNLIDLFYKAICPFAFSVINIVRMFKEWRTSSWIFPTIIDTVICFGIVILLASFFFAVYNRASDWCKKFIPGARRLSSWVHKILKGV